MNKPTDPDSRERERWLATFCGRTQPIRCDNHKIHALAMIRRRDERERRRGIALASLDVREQAVRSYMGKQPAISLRDMADDLQLYAGPSAMAWARKRKGNK